jgi:hypothetical protein
MINFTRKGYGRIYVENKEDISKVIEIIKEIDEYEATYMPPDLIGTFDEFPKIVYTHKFDSIDINVLTIKCWSKNIKIFCLDNGFQEFWMN